MLALAGPRSHLPDQDTQFVALLDAFRPSGGLARADEVTRRWRLHQPNAPFRLARWIARRRLVSLWWSDAHWVPLFQLQHARLHPCPGLCSVLAELRPVFTDWELARWFVAPNVWLADRAPADLMQANTEAVFHAARADRFAVTG